MDLELDSLISRALDGSLDDAEMRQLQQRLIDDGAALATYMETVAVEVLLEEQAETQPLAVFDHLSARRSRRSDSQARTAVAFFRWFPPIAASVLFAVSIVLFVSSDHRGDAPQAAVASDHENDNQLDLASNQVSDESLPYPELTNVGSNEKLSFEMPTGVSIVLHGPARFQVTARDELTLAEGIVRASVPEQGRGFRVITPNGDVIDHGTEIGVSVNSQHTELHVFEGRAEVVLPDEHSSRMVGINEAVRVFHPNNSGYEPIPLNPEPFGWESRSQRIEFGFDSTDAPWDVTLSGRVVDRGDKPPTDLTAGRSRFAKILGLVGFPTHEDAIGTFHELTYFAPQRGDGRVAPLPFHYRDSMESLCLTSPPFMLDLEGGPLTAYITGGRGRAAAPPSTFDDLPRQSSGEGYLGLALRRVRDGKYVCSVRRKPGNFYDWDQVEISESELREAMTANVINEVFVLDVIDTYRDPDWSWIGVDSISVPGILVEEP